MDYSFGIKGKDFVMLCCDCTLVQSIIRLKSDEDKIFQVTDSCMMATTGEAGDRVQFAEYIIANIKLYSKLHGTELSTKAIAHFTRTQLANSLRKSPYMANLLIAGYDDDAGPQLYWMDYLATMQSVNVGGTGYGALFANSIMDRNWTQDITEEQALVLMEKGVDEVRKRFVAGQPSFLVKVVDKKGIRTVKVI